MQLQATLLALYAVLHALVIIKGGLKDKANVPFLIFMFVDAILTVIVFLQLPHSLRATLLLSAFGLVGLTVTFNKPQPPDQSTWSIIGGNAASWFLFA